jgi:uncharacterized membrane protein
VSDLEVERLDELAAALRAEIARLTAFRSTVARTGDGDATRWRMLGVLDDIIANLRAALAEGDE